MKIYISGPITGTDDYMERFAKAESILTEAGFSVVNPAKVNAEMPKDTTYSEYMEMSMTMESICEAVYFLEGWQYSSGAMTEFEYAYEHKKIILFEGVKIECLTLRHEDVNSISEPA